MSPADVLATVRASLEAIADALDEVSFVVPRREREVDERRRSAVVETTRRYLLHRLREPDAPIVAALVGLSGVGKSTIINSLAQDAITTPGVVRPTTTNGVLWAHRDHAARYWTEFVSRVRRHIGPTTDVVIGTDPLTRYLTFVDTPPLELAPQDSATTADQTLMFADLCIFVTSAERYADAAPLDFLESARARGIPILFVLNRLPPDPPGRSELLTDFASTLVAAGLLHEPDPDFIFGIDESSRRRHGGLAPEAVAALRQELSEISDPEFRVTVIDETAEATLLAVAERAESLSVALRREDSDRRFLRGRAEHTYAAAGDRIVAELDAGSYSALAGHGVWSQAAIDLAGVVTRAAGVAAEETARDWLDRPEARGLIDPGHEGLRRHGADAADGARAALDDWAASLGTMVSEMRGRRPRKRKLRRLVDDLWRGALDPEFESRRWKRDGREAFAQARASLGAAMRQGVLSDAERFYARLGADVPDGVADRIAAAAAYLRDVPDAEGISAEPEGATNAV